MQRNPDPNSNVSQIRLAMSYNQWETILVDNPGIYLITGTVSHRNTLQIKFTISEGEARVIFDNCHIANDANLLIQGNSYRRCLVQFMRPLDPTVTMKVQRVRVCFGDIDVTRDLELLTLRGNTLSMEYFYMRDASTAQPIGNLAAQFRINERQPTSAAPSPMGIPSNTNRTHASSQPAIGSSTNRIPPLLTPSTAAMFIVLQVARNMINNQPNTEFNIQNTLSNRNDNAMPALPHIPTPSVAYVSSPRPQALPPTQPVIPRTYTSNQHSGRTYETIQTALAYSRAPVIPVPNLTQAPQSNLRNHNNRTDVATQTVANHYSPQVAHYVNSFKDSENEKLWKEVESLPDEIKNKYKCPILQDVPKIPVFIEQQIYDYESLKTWAEGPGKRGPGKFTDPSSHLEVHLSKISTPIKDFWSMLKFRIFKSKQAKTKFHEKHRENRGDKDKEHREDGEQFKRKRFN